MFSRKALAILCCMIGAASVNAQTLSKPTAPSNLKVTPVGVNSFLMEWQDNSNNEAGWEIRVSLGTTANPVHYQFIAAPNITSYVVMTNDLPGKTLSFQLAAYNGVSGAEQISDPTTAVTVVALSPTTFGAPTNLTATTLDDGRIRLAWTDNSTSESGYQVEVKVGTGDWGIFGNTDPGVTFDLPAAGFDPTTTYSFRTRAFKGNPTVFTAYSNEATATTKAFQAPTKFVAKAEGEGGISMSWKDNSAIESGYEIQWKTGTADFASLGEVGQNSTSTGIVPGFSLDTKYTFRIRAFRIVASAKTYTAFSTYSSVTTSSLYPPTGFAGQVLGPDSVKFTWTDASSLENGYEVQGRILGTTDFKTMGSTAANIKTLTLTGLAPGTTYEFRLRAYSLYSSSAFTAVIQATTNDGFISDLNPPVFWKTSFLHQIEVSRPDHLTSLTVTGLPAGFTYDSTLHKITGTPSVEGVRNIWMTATYDSGYSITRALVLRIIRTPSPPIANGTFTPVVVAAGATSRTSLNGRFSDPDTRDARHVSTTVGDFDIILYPLATPVTVANFLDYADGGLYTNSFFHRSVADFIVQAGGYRYDTTNGYRTVTPFAAIQNEPGISNLKGTVAMAKVDGNPNSATCEFFVNLNDANAPNLDYQNGGFTVFGRIAGNGMNIINPINALPLGNYTLSVNGTSRSLSDVPVKATTAPTTLDPGLLVKINSVTTVPILKYSVTSVSTAVATAKISGTDVVITGVAHGTTTIRVKVTDLDGNSIYRTIAVTVN